jgi:hypothetical protein
VDATAVPGIDFLQLTLRELGLAAADLVYATASLLKRGTFGYSPYTTGRSAIEAMAVMYWLLDPDIDGPSRVERAITEYLDSVRYEPTKRQRSFVTALEQLEGIELNIERAKKSPGKPFYVGLPMPSRTKLVADLSRGYKELSAMAHVGPLGRRAATRRIPLEGGTRTEIRGDKDMLLGLFEAVRVASRLTLDRLAGYTHWSREAFDEAERRALKILSDAAL